MMRTLPIRRQHLKLTESLLCTGHTRTNSCLYDTPECPQTNLFFYVFREEKREERARDLEALFHHPLGFLSVFSGAPLWG